MKPVIHPNPSKKGDLVMNRIHRTALLAALGFVLAVTAGQAQTPPPSIIPSLVIRPFCGITVVGAGATEAEALAIAQAELAAKYRVFSSRVVSSRCDTFEVLDPTYNDPFHTTTMTFCSVELSACGVYKVVWVTR
jgi:hypothetical protein